MVILRATEGKPEGDRARNSGTGFPLGRSVSDAARPTGSFPSLAQPKGLPTNPRTVPLEVILERDSSRSRDNACLASTPSTPTDANKRWGPNGPIILAAHTSGPDLRNAKLEQLTVLLAGMTAAPSYGGQNGMPDDPQGSSQTTLFSSARPRANYWWLHGWNNVHNGVECKVMTNDPANAARMKNATGPHGTGGNPKIGVPVTYNRPKFFFPLAQPLSCSPCHHTPNSNPLPCLILQPGLSRYSISPTAAHLPHHSSVSAITPSPSLPSPLIADTGCTGVLLQLCNFPSLRPLFSPKPLPCLPFTCLTARSCPLVVPPTSPANFLSLTKSLPSLATSSLTQQVR